MASYFEQKAAEIACVLDDLAALGRSFEVAIPPIMAEIIELTTPNPDIEPINAAAIAAMLKEEQYDRRNYVSPKEAYHRGG